MSSFQVVQKMPEHLLKELFGDQGWEEVLGHKREKVSSSENTDLEERFKAALNELESVRQRESQERCMRTMLERWCKKLEQRSALPVTNSGQ